MDKKFEAIRNDCKKRFEDAQYSDGKIERMQDRIECLENAVAHLMAFLAKELRLMPDEIHNEDGLTDW